MGAPGPVMSPSGDRARTWLTFAGGIAATAALVVGLIAFWPESDGGPRRQTAEAGGTAALGATTTTRARTGAGEPSEQSTTIPPTSAPPVAGDLFHGDLPAAYGDLRAASGNPSQVIEVAVYDTYAFLAYRDPADPGNLDRRMWRDGEVGAAEANPIDDRVDADTEPALFDPGEIHPELIAALVADAPSHYDIATHVTHVLVTRFLPFDQRVLMRVYATPDDGRSGGGYVSYDTAGVFVKVCC